MKQDIHPYCLRERTAEQCEDKKDKKSVLLRIESLKRGTIAAIGGTQLVIVRKANSAMGTNRHDAPAGYIVKGMDTVIDSLFAYNDIIDNLGPGPDQTKVHVKEWIISMKSF